jgi:hypothetical protein
VRERVGRRGHRPEARSDRDMLAANISSPGEVGAGLDGGADGGERRQRGRSSGGRGAHGRRGELTCAWVEGRGGTKSQALARILVTIAGDLRTRTRDRVREAVLTRSAGLFYFS